MRPDHSFPDGTLADRKAGRRSSIIGGAVCEKASANPLGVTVSFEVDRKEFQEGKKDGKDAEATKKSPAETNTQIKLGESSPSAQDGKDAPTSTKSPAKINPKPKLEKTKDAEHESAKDAESGRGQGEEKRLAKEKKEHKEKKD